MSPVLLAHAVVLASLLALSHGLLRQAASLDTVLWAWPRVGYSVAAMSLYVLIFAYYASLLERMPLSRLYPVYTGLSVVLVYTAGVTWFDESWSARSVAGVVLLVIGVLLVGDPAAQGR